MNNILKKNIIKKEDAASTTLPHSTSYDVAVKTNQIVHAALNYALQKLIDNDLYIEKKLIYKSNYTIGPLKKNEEDIPLYVDNIKFFDGIDGGANDLSVVQKIPYDLTATIENTLNLSVQFLHDSVCYLATTTYGIYQSTDNMNTWQRLSGISNLPTGNYHVQYLQNNHENIVFATPDAVYKIESIDGIVNPDAEQPTCKQIFGKYQHDVSVYYPNTVAALNGNALFVGNEHGLYCSTQKDGQGKYTNPIKENTIVGNVNCLEFLSGENGTDKLLVGVDGISPGLYASKKQYSFYDMKQVNAVEGINYSIVIDDVLYVAGSLGLSCINIENQQLVPINELESYRVNKLVKVGIDANDDIYACTNAGVWKLNVSSDRTTATQILTKFTSNVVDICYVNGMTVVAEPLSVNWANCKISEAAETTEWNINSSFGSQEIIGLVPQNYNLNVYTKNAIFTLDIGLSYSSHEEDDLMTVFANKPDITTVYFDDDGKVLIGTVSGLFDENFDYIQYAGSDNQAPANCNITSHVNKVRYLQIFGKDVWCICTQNGAYMLQQGEPDSTVNWILNGQHLFPGKDVVDITYNEASKSLAIGVGKILYCLVLPNSVLSNSESFTQTQYIINENNYTKNELSDDIKSLANFAGKIIVLKENLSKSTTAIELFQNFSGSFERTTFFTDKTVADLLRIQTFVTNGYSIENYARTTEPALYKYVPATTEEEQATFNKIIPDITQLSSTRNKLEIALAYRHLIDPTDESIPKSICMLPSDRFSEILLVSTNDNKVSAYDIYDMKVDRYISAYSTYPNPTGLRDILKLNSLQPKDNVKTTIANVNSPIKDISYVVNTTKTDIIDQQKNMQCFIATDISVAVFNTIFKREESLKFKRLDPEHDEYGEMQHFALIPYGIRTNQELDSFERKYVYIGISNNRLYRYFEDENDDSDFDTGYMTPVTDIMIDHSTMPGNEIGFLNYAFSYDKPFVNTIVELKNKFQNSLSSAGSQAKFILFATTAGPLAATISYGNPDAYHDWFVNFTKIPGLPDGELPIDVCRLGDYMYVATDTHVYRLSINACKLDELGQIALTDAVMLIRYNNSLEFDSIRKILTIGNEIYVLGRHQNVECLTRITGTIQTISDGIDSSTDIAALPGTSKAVIKTGTTQLKVFDSSKTTNYINALSTEMKYNAVVQNKILTATDDGIDHYAEVSENVVLTGNFPCSADRIFTQYDYIQNKYNVYFATTWHNIYNSYYIPEYDQTNQVTVDLSGISKYNGDYSKIEFDFNDAIQYDASQNAISDETIAIIEVNRGTTPHSVSAIANNTAMYLARPADDKDDSAIDKYGITYMFFTKSGEIYSGSYGFDIDEIHKQLSNGGSGYSLEDLHIPGATIQCMDAQTFDSAIALYEVTYIHGKAVTTIDEGSTVKNIQLEDGSVITVENGKSGDLVYVNSGLFGTDDLEFVWDGQSWRQQQIKHINVSIAAIGSTSGLVVKLPGSDIFNKPIIIGNDVLDKIVGTSIKSVSISESSLTFITDDNELVNIPYEIGLNGQLSFLASNAKFAQIAAGNSLNDILIMPKTNIESEAFSNNKLDDELEYEYILAAMSTSGIYEPMYNYSIKNETPVANNVDILYQHDVGMFLVNGRILSSYENLEDITQYTTITADNTVNFIYENSKSTEIYYGSGNGVFVISRYPESTVENVFDATANSLLKDKNVQSIFKKDDYYCYEISADGKHDIVKTTTKKVKDTIIHNDSNSLFQTIQQITNVFNYNTSQLFVVCAHPVLVDRLTKTAEDFTTNITPVNSVTYFNALRPSKSEFAIADRNLYYRHDNKSQFQQICLDVPLEVFLFQEIDPSRIVLINDKWLVDKTYGIFLYKELDFVRQYNKLVNRAVMAMLKIDSNTVLVGTSNGLYKYSDGNLMMCNVLAKTTIDSISFAETNINGYPTYYLTSGPKVYKTKDKNLMLADLLFDLSAVDTDINKITNVKKFGKKAYVFGTNIGVLNTYDKYRLVDTWSKQNTNGISKAIKECYDKFILTHIKEQHGLNSNVTTVNNTVMPIDLSEMPDNWQTTTNYKNIVKNDYVDEVEFNGDVKYITAEYSNFTTSYSNATSSNSYQSIDGITYIMKKYKSNMKELYIYIPTTGTQYVNHVEGMQYCTNSNYAFTRSNADVAISGTVADLKTKLRVWLDAEHFDFNEIYNVFINGNSLPLKIFTDTEKHDVGESQQYFHSYMEPSIVNTLPACATINDNKISLQNVKNGKYFFDFSCFGTDAQSIKIIAKSYNKYKIVFNANGASKGKMEDIVLKEDQQITLPECEYIKDGYVFKGWSLSENGAIKYANKESIVNLTNSNNAIINLYAVWQYYAFDSSIDTILRLQSNKKEFLLASSEPAENASNVVVDYDYVGDTTIIIQPNGNEFSISNGTLLPDQTTVIVEFED